MSFQSENTSSSVNSMNQGSVTTKLSSLDRSMTIIDGCASESFGIINPEKIPQQEAQKEQRVVRQPSEYNNDLRPVVTVDNSLLIKIMARLNHCCGYIDVGDGCRRRNVLTTTSR